MSELSSPAAAISQRSRVLAALGVVPWVRHTRGTRAAAVPPDAVAPFATGERVACVVVVAEGCSTRELDLLGRALNACGATLARAARLTLRNGELDGPVPDAAAYLVFGEAQAHALGRRLPATSMQRAHIVLADELASLLTSAAAKRRLWSALRTMRRALVTTGA